MMKKIFAVAALAIGLISNASANIVYENGTDGVFCCGNNPFTYQVVTQDFTLGNSAAINSLTYNAYTRPNTVAVTNVFVEILQGSSTLYTGNLSVANTQVIGTDGFYSFTDYTVNLPSVMLAAGTYTLGLEVSPTQWDEHWSITQNNVGPRGSDGFSHYFRLEGGAAVPEPASIAILGLGLAGLAAARRRKNV